MDATRQVCANCSQPLQSSCVCLSQVSSRAPLQQANRKNTEKRWAKLATPQNQRIPRAYLLSQRLSYNHPPERYNQEEGLARQLCGSGSLSRQRVVLPFLWQHEIAAPVQTSLRPSPVSSQWHLENEMTGNKDHQHDIRRTTPVMGATYVGRLEQSAAKSSVNLWGMGALSVSVTMASSSVSSKLLTILTSE
nr:hypothetical protein Iba_chr13eCG2610 [Ipomoea batatas]